METRQAIVRYRDILLPERYTNSTAKKAESIRSQGTLSPLHVRPLTDQSIEIVAGARRYRAAHLPGS